MEQTVLVAFSDDGDDDDDARGEADLSVPPAEYVQMNQGKSTSWLVVPVNEKEH